MNQMSQGGNPLGVVSVEQLLEPGVRFVNRDPDSGTRLLFDQLLAQQGLDGSRINGYAQVEFTHAAVAAYVEGHEGRLMRSLLFGVGVTDAATFGAVPVLLICIAFFASYIPARRASRIDPGTSLRCE